MFCRFLSGLKYYLRLLSLIVRELLEIQALLADMERESLPDFSHELLLALEESEVRQKPEAAAQPVITREELQELMEFAIEDGDTDMMVSVAEDIIRSWEPTFSQGGRTHLLKPEKEVGPASEMTYEEMKTLIDLYGDDDSCQFSTTIKSQLQYQAFGIYFDDTTIRERFDKEGDLYHWRTVPEYTANEKRRLLAKDRIDFHRNINTVDSFSSVIPRVSVHRVLFIRSGKPHTCH